MVDRNTFLKPPREVTLGDSPCRTARNDVFSSSVAANDRNNYSSREQLRMDEGLPVKQQARLERFFRDGRTEKSVYRQTPGVTVRNQVSSFGVVSGAPVTNPSRQSARGDRGTLGEPRGKPGGAVSSTAARNPIFPRSAGVTVLDPTSGVTDVYRTGEASSAKRRRGRSRPTRDRSLMYAW